MGKESGWVRYKVTNRGYAIRRTGENLRKVHTQRDFNALIDNPRGPVSVALAETAYQQSYVDIDPTTGEYRIKPEAVRRAASDFVTEARPAIERIQTERSAEDRVKEVQEVYQDVGLGRRAAENHLNRTQAAHATAILLSARIANIELSHEQRRALQKVKAGGYVDLLRERDEQAARALRASEYNSFGRVGKYDRDNRSIAQKEEDSMRFRDFNQNLVGYGGVNYGMR